MSVLGSRRSRGGRSRLWIAALIAAAIILPIAWYLASPLFINRTVEEELPLTRGAVIPRGVDRAEAERQMRASAGEERRAAESMPAPMREARRLASGSFEDADSFHQGSGTAHFLELSGQRLLRIEDLDVTNGPNLFVYVSAHPAPRTSAELHDDGDYEVAPLKGNRGDQNYELPPDLDIGRYRSVVIYCKRFAVVFSTARLTAGS